MITFKHIKCSWNTANAQYFDLSSLISINKFRKVIQSLHLADNDLIMPTTVLAKSGLYLTSQMNDAYCTTYQNRL